MPATDTNFVLDAYREATGRSWNDAAGIRAAEAAYGEQHPEIDDASLVSERVAILIALAMIIDPESFWRSPA